MLCLHPQGCLRRGVRASGPSQERTGESGAFGMWPPLVARLEFPRETGLILRCAGRAGNPFRTTRPGTEPRQNFQQRPREGRIKRIVSETKNWTIKTHKHSLRKRPCRIGTRSCTGERYGPLRREVKEPYCGVGVLCGCHMHIPAEVQ